jgi:tetratricopeptide (TPR) repeat protein
MPASASSTPEPHGLEVLRTYGDGFAGRQEELKALDQAWNEGITRVFVLHAEGGAGKTRVVAQWLNQMRDDGYRNAGRVFVHSFYSQGSDARRNASSELFFEQALEYFGYAGPRLIDSTEQGRTLARLIREQRGLLVLDGLEPLQHPPSFDEGRLKDPGIRSLLLSLASGLADGGLCVATSRQPVVELKNKTGRVVIQQPLDRLDAEAGLELLRQLEVRGPEWERRQAIEDSRGHAYSLMLLGTYLRDATDDHEIRRRSEIPLLAEDSEHRYHARHLFGAYVKHLGESSPEVAVLRLLGFFDRPAEETLMIVLREATESGLDVVTAPLRKLSSAEWRRVLRRLIDLRLIDAPTSLFPPIDSHPLLREYFAEQLRKYFPEAWPAGHRQLFEYLRQATEYRPVSLPGLQPLYQAVVHGCLAGLHEQTLTTIYLDRILRGTKTQGFYSSRILGALGADLAAVASFFTTPWTTVSPKLAPIHQAWVLDQAAFCLRGLGRLDEAVEPIRIGLASEVARQDWPNAARGASHLSKLELSRGAVDAAVAAGQLAVAYTNHGREAPEVGADPDNIKTLANALHQAGRLIEAKELFDKVEARPAGEKPVSFRFCDLLLSEAERAAWQRFLLIPATVSPDRYEDFGERTTYIRTIPESDRWLLNIAMNHLIGARVALYRADFARPIPRSAYENVTSAVHGVRKAGRSDHLPQVLLTRAWLRWLAGDETGCHEDLDEAWEIADRGPMPLFQADIQLYRARLFRDRGALAEARRLIEKHGYHRRDGELVDAEAAAEHWDDKEPSVPNKVFISYSHDSEQHSQRVLALANQLRHHGVDAELDQYETRPPQGWPRWCEEQLRPENSEHVLVVCTETYLNRIEGKAPADEGRGVFWEGDVIYSYLYEQKSKERFIPILFDRKDEANIPRPLKGAAHYQITAFDLSDAGYESLYRELTHQPAVKRPPLGEVVTLRGRGLPLDMITVLPPVAPREVRSTFSVPTAAPTEADLLEELKRLPPAWFEELVLHFDANSAVSARPAPQAMRAIDLLTVVRVLADGPMRLRAEIRRLKGDRG